MTKLNRSYDFVLDGSENNSHRTKKNNEFDRSEFYLEYYKNLTPSDFNILKDGNKIIIEVPDRT